MKRGDVKYAAACGAFLAVAAPVVLVAAPVAFGLWGVWAGCQWTYCTAKATWQLYRYC